MCSCQYSPRAGGVDNVKMLGERKGSERSVMAASLPQGAVIGDHEEAHCSFSLLYFLKRHDEVVDIRLAVVHEVLRSLDNLRTNLF